MVGGVLAGASGLLADGDTSRGWPPSADYILHERGTVGRDGTGLVCSREMH